METNNSITIITKRTPRFNIFQGLESVPSNPVKTKTTLLEFTISTRVQTNTAHHYNQKWFHSLVCRKPKAPKEENPINFPGAELAIIRKLDTPGNDESVLLLHAFGTSIGTALETSAMGNKQLARSVFPVLVKQLSQ